MLIAKLLVVGGEVKTTEIKLRLPCVIGRGKGSTVTLPHPLVSRQHCELFESNGRLWVRDLGSLNGTYVNNEKVTETELPPNELLTIGTVTFRAVYEPALHDGTVSDQAALVAPTRAPAAHESVSTVRVDAPVNNNGSPEGMTSLGAGNFDGIDQDVDELGLMDEDGVMPSAPLYAAEAPASPSPVLPPQHFPGTPAIPTMGITPTPVHVPSPEKPDEPIVEEVAGDDDDLNDFLKSIGKK